VALESWGTGVLWYVVFVASVTVHEAAHACAALKGGDPTAYLGGQVSLDPEPHIRRSPMGMVVVPLISLVWMGWPFGFAATPFDPEWAHRYPRRAAAMSLAGPAANLALALTAGVGIRLGVLTGVFVRPASVSFDHVVSALNQGVWPTAAHVLSMLFTMNLILFVLNMMPVPPLDGSGALGLLLPDESGRRLQALLRNPTFSMLGLVLAWNVFGPLFRPIFFFTLQLLFPGVHYS